jgi:hypothetical protein
MAVQQHDRFPLAAVPHAERHVADIDALQLEPIEHAPHLPMRPSANRGAPLTLSPRCDELIFAGGRRVSGSSPAHREPVRWRCVGLCSQGEGHRGLRGLAEFPFFTIGW